MKVAIATSVLALATSTLAAVIPLGSSGAFFTDETEIIKRAAQDSRYCVQVQSTISGWYYSFTGIWGSDSGEGPSFAGTFCVPTNNGAGGAMYIGPHVSISLPNNTLKTY